MLMERHPVQDKVRATMIQLYREILEERPEFTLEQFIAIVRNEMDIAKEEEAS